MGNACSSSRTGLSPCSCPAGLSPQIPCSHNPILLPIGLHLSVPSWGQGLVAALALQAELVPILAQGGDLLSCGEIRMNECPVPTWAVLSRCPHPYSPISCSVPHDVPRAAPAPCSYSPCLFLLPALPHTALLPFKYLELPCPPGPTAPAHFHASAAVPLAQTRTQPASGVTKAGFSPGE